MLKAILNKLDIIVCTLLLFGIVCLFPILINLKQHPIYFIAVGIGFVCVLFYLIYAKRLNIINTEIRNWKAYSVLVLICIVGLSQIWYVNLQFPSSLIGIDVWTHQRIVNQELEISLNPEPNIYAIAHLNLSILGGYFSLMHLYLKSMMDIFWLNYKWTSLIFWGSLNTIGNIVFTYLIGKELVNRKVGLLAAFMISIAGWVVYFEEWNIPNSIGALFCLIVAYLFIKSYKVNKHWIVWLSLPILIIAFFTHALVSVWVIGTIVCLSVCTLVIDYIMPKQEFI
jgi:hypothetical protein